MLTAAITTATDREDRTACATANPDGPAIDLLPDELMVAILSRVGCAWLRASIAVVCRRWHQIVLDYIPRRCRGRASGLGREWATLEAVHLGHPDCLDHLEGRGLLYWSKSVAYTAAASGHLGILERARTAKCPWDETACQAAARSGRLDVLQWLRRHGCPWDERTAHGAALGGHIACLQWALEHGCPQTDWTAEGAAAGGRLDVLVWLDERWHAARPKTSGVPSSAGVALNGVHLDSPVLWTTRATAAAARGGHLACLEYLHVRGCPWDACTMTAAATWGHLDCLAHGYEHGCPWDAGTTSGAFYAKRTECLAYAVEHGCPLWDRVASRLLCA